MAPTFVAALSLECDLGKVARVGEWMGKACETADPARLQEFELAVVEAVTNIIRHGGIAGSGQAIDLELRREGTAVEIVITDRGSPIPEDALARSHAALDFDPDDIDNLPTGGLGLALIREVSDVFDYSSAGGVNTMRLVKTC